jgi:aryl-alcohol dehydrogenase-like predicted oxidoreductase
MAFKEYGINFLDSAEMYPVPTKAETTGRTDLIIGKWLKTMNRQEVILASKVAGPGIPWLAGRDGQGSRVSASQIAVSVDESLKRLSTDYIDLLQIHWPDRYVPIFGAQGYNASLERDAISFEEQLIALDKLVKAGKVRHIGVSNESPYGVMKFSQVAKDLGLSKMVTIQNSYSLLVRNDFENSLAEVCSPRNENIGLLAYSPLAGGILTGKYAKPDCPATARLNLFEGYMARFKQSLAVSAVAEYVEIAESVGLAATELALAWCYKQPHVASTIIGATSVKQLRENIDAYGKMDMIDDVVTSRINDVYKRFKDPAKA